MEKEKGIIDKRRAYLTGIKKEQNAEAPKHKYVKNFNHLIAIISNALDGDGFKDYLNERNSKGHGLTLSDVCTDANIYYEHVYKQPYCDQFTWLINNNRPDLLILDVLKMELSMYLKTNRFCGKSYGKLLIDIPEELKGK